MEALIKKALAKHKRKKFSEARKIYLKILKKNPSHLDANYLLGTLYAEKKLLKEAEHYLKKSTKINPSSPMIQVNLGNVFKQQDNIPMAEKCYLRALELKPDLAEAHYGLGCMWQRNRKKSYQEIFDCFQKAISLNPHLAEGYQMIGYLLSKANDPKSLEYFQRARQLNPSMEGLDKDTGIALIRFGKYEEAAATLLAAGRQAPDDVEIKYFLDIARGKQPDPEIQRQYVQKEFDNFADSFDRKLTGELGYDIPLKGRNLLEELCGPELHFDCVADLGCGTGLNGLVYKGCCDYMIGIDLSPKMLEKAEIHGCYDRLIQGEICEALNTLDARFDLFVAMDVIVYLGKLDALFRAVKKNAQPQALWIFSTEHTSDGNEYILQSSGRYAHSKEYIQSLSDRNGCSIMRQDLVPIRKEGNEWIQGNVFIIGLP
jgi:predicted TPR repeat methyltransferase